MSRSSSVSILSFLVIIMMAMLVMVAVVVVVDAKKVTLRFNSDNLPSEPLIGGEQWLYLSHFVFDNLGTTGDQWDGKITYRLLSAPTHDPLSLHRRNLSLVLYNDEDTSWPALMRDMSAMKRVNGTSMSCAERVASRYVKARIDLDSERSRDKHDIIVHESSRPYVWYMMLDGCQHINSMGNKEASLRGMSFELHWVNPGGWLWSEFSWDEHSLLLVRLITFPVLCTVATLAIVVYVAHDILVVKRTYALRVLPHPAVMLFAGAAALWLLSCTATLVHWFVFAFNGYGVMELFDVGTLAHMMSELVFTVLLLLLANGWTITQHRVRRYSKTTMQVIGIALLVAYCSLFSWSKVVVSQSTSDYIYMEVPGLVICLLRVPCMVYLLYSAVSTLRREKTPKKKIFYGVFAAVYAAWLAFLPLLVTFAYVLPNHWRMKVIDNVQYFVYTAALCTMLAMLLYSKFQAFFMFHYEDYEVQQEKMAAQSKGDEESRGIIGGGGRGSAQVVSANEADFGEL